MVYQYLPYGLETTGYWTTMCCPAAAGFNRFMSSIYYSGAELVRDLIIQVITMRAKHRDRGSCPAPASAKLRLMIEHHGHVDSIRHAWLVVEARRRSRVLRSLSTRARIRRGKRTSESGSVTIVAIYYDRYVAPLWCATCVSARWCVHDADFQLTTPGGCPRAGQEFILPRRRGLQAIGCVTAFPMRSHSPSRSSQPPRLYPVHKAWGVGGAIRQFCFCSQVLCAVNNEGTARRQVKLRG